MGEIINYTSAPPRGVIVPKYGGRLLRLWLVVMPICLHQLKLVTLMHELDIYSNLLS
jgi:hypothetical protein